MHKKEIFFDGANAALLIMLLVSSIIKTPSKWQTIMNIVLAILWFINYMLQKYGERK